MDHNICFNSLSLPATDPEAAYVLLSSAFQGILQLNTGQDRYILFYDGASLSECSLATGYNFADYKTNLSDENEIDLLYFVNEIEDKAPFIDNIAEEEFEELTTFQIYFDGREYVAADIFGLAYMKQAYMLSLATDRLWANHLIPFNIIAKEHTPIKCAVFNISSIENALEILKRHEVTLTDLLPNTNLSDPFLQWYNGLGPEDKNKTKEVLVHCFENGFNIGRPRIDTIKGSAIPNMKEIRAGNAHSTSGKIRILFALDPNRTVNILVGFIKHSNDYTAPIKEADYLFQAVLTSYKLASES